MVQERIDVKLMMENVKCQNWQLSVRVHLTFAINNITYTHRSSKIREGQILNYDSRLMTIKLPPVSQKNLPLAFGETAA